MDPATENENGKRVRFLSDEKAEGASSGAKAKQVVSLILASLSPSAQILAKQYSKKFFELRSEIARFGLNRTKLANTDFIPISARLKFQLGISDRVKEKAPDKYMTLLQNTDHQVLVIQDQLKDKVVEALDIEIEIAQAELASIFCTAVGSLGIVLTMLEPTIADQLARTLVLHTFEMYHTVLLKHSGIETLSDFFTGFKEATVDSLPVHETGTLHPDDIQVVQPLVDSFKSIIEGIFVRTWDVVLESQAETKRKIAAQQFVKFQLTEAATVAVAIDLESEGPSDAALESLVAAQVSKKTKQLQAKIDRLERQLRPKNSQGGQPSSAPSQKKKKDRKLNASAPSAAASANASTGSKKKSNENNSKKKQGKTQKKKEKPARK